MTQTRFNSFLESLIGALLAAPTATILHWLLLDLWGEQIHIDPILKTNFVIISWTLFLIHSMVWKYIIRRVLIHYNRENII